MEDGQFAAPLRTTTLDTSIVFISVASHWEPSSAV